MLLTPSLPSSEQMKCTSVSLCLPVTSQPSPALYTCNHLHQANKIARKVMAALCWFTLAMQKKVARPKHSGNLLVTSTEHCLSDSKDAAADLLYKS